MISDCLGADGDQPIPQYRLNIVLTSDIPRSSDFDKFVQ